MPTVGSTRMSFRSCDGPGWEPGTCGLAASSLHSYEMILRRGTRCGKGAKEGQAP